MKNLIVTLTLSIVSWMCYSQVEPIAYYPFISDAIDSISGESASVRNATFSEGGIYSNGIYYGNDTSGTEIITAPLEDLNFSNFQFTLEFRIDSLPNLPWMPIIVGGPSWRWLNILVQNDGILGVRASTNTGTIQLSSPMNVTLGDWHQLDVRYVDQEISVNLDGTEALRFEAQQFVDGNDRRLICADNGVGRTFKGYWRNLRVFSSDATSSQVQTAINALTVFPNPSSSTLRITGLDIQRAETFQLIDIDGHIIHDFTIRKMPFDLNVSHIDPGFYLLVSTSRSQLSPTRVIINR